MFFDLQEPLYDLFLEYYLPTFNETEKIELAKRIKNKDDNIKLLKINYIHIMNNNTLEISLSYDDDQIRRSGSFLQNIGIVIVDNVIECIGDDCCFGYYTLK